MPRTDRFRERIGGIFLPEAQAIFPDSGPALPPIGMPPPPGSPQAEYRSCTIDLRAGCYALEFTPVNPTSSTTWFRGTLRVEKDGTGLIISGDLYAHQPLDRLLDHLLGGPIDLVDVLEDLDAESRVQAFPVYARSDYHSYLKGTGAQLSTTALPDHPCTFSLTVDEYEFSHGTGFQGTFDETRDRALRFVLTGTPVPDTYEGTVFEETTQVGTVSLSRLSDALRRAELHITNFTTTDCAVDGAGIAAIFEAVGWELAVVDHGTQATPAGLQTTARDGSWTPQKLHTLMATVPGYATAVLDSAWRVHLLVVPTTAAPDPSFGCMFDQAATTSGSTTQPAREGCVVYSDAVFVETDANEHYYDAAEDMKSHEVPRAYLRSAAHETGHAFNQCHEHTATGYNENSIMTPTRSAAMALNDEIFPDALTLEFSTRVCKHLNHWPDPTVRPGAVDAIFGQEQKYPQPADIIWLDHVVDLIVEFGTTTPRLGEPIIAALTLVNRSAARLPVPAVLDTRSWAVRINVTDPAGGITFLRPHDPEICPEDRLQRLDPDEQARGRAVLFWGRDGFAFPTPGRHVVEVIVLWQVAGAFLAVSTERTVVVEYPTSRTDNVIAALLLDPRVGLAVQAGDPTAVEGAEERIREAFAVDPDHPAVTVLQQLGLIPLDAGS